MAESYWSDEDTRICDAAIASGKAISVATGKPMTFKELQALHDEYGRVGGSVAPASFIRDRVRTEPFDDRT